MEAGIFMDEEKNAISQQNYSIRDGFLFKGDTPVSLVTSGIVESAVKGFLHVDETEEYKTK
jgi:hypothetical protein